MGIKISELTTANTLRGNELTPLVQSTETRQAAVSSVFTALTSQNDNPYVCGISSSDQGCLTFTGAGGGTIDLGLSECNNVSFGGLTTTSICNQGTATMDNVSTFKCNAIFCDDATFCCNVNIVGSTTAASLNASNINATCNVTVTCNVDTNTLTVANYISHKGDSTTCINFGNGNMELYAGTQTNGGPGIQIASGYVAINEDFDPDMDLCVRYSGGTGTALFADGSSGNVGIDTTTPNEKFTVSGNISATGDTTIDGGLNVGGNSYFTGNVIDFDAGTSINFAGQNATFDNAVSFNNGAHFTTEDLCVTGANVGIGTTTPNETLTVSGNICASGKLIVGNCNIAGCSGAAVVGGCQNVSYGRSSFIGGGQNNTICGSGSTGSIVGGCNNVVCHGCSAIIGGTCTTSVSANMLHVNRLYASDLPTSDPGVAGVVWNCNGALKISV